MNRKKIILFGSSLEIAFNKMMLKAWEQITPIKSPIMTPPIILTPRQQEVFDVLDNTKGKHPREIATELNYSESAWIGGSLKALVKKGLAYKTGFHKNTKYFKK